MPPSSPLTFFIFNLFHLLRSISYLLFPSQARTNLPNPHFFSYGQKLEQEQPRTISSSSHVIPRNSSSRHFLFLSMKRKTKSSDLYFFHYGRKFPRLEQEVIFFSSSHTHIPNNNYKHPPSFQVNWPRVEGCKTKV